MPTLFSLISCSLFNTQQTPLHKQIHLAYSVLSRVCFVVDFFLSNLPMPCFSSFNLFKGSLLSSKTFFIAAWYSVCLPLRLIFQTPENPFYFKLERRFLGEQSACKKWVRSFRVFCFPWNFQRRSKRVIASTLHENGASAALRHFLCERAEQQQGGVIWNCVAVGGWWRHDVA